MINAQGYAVLEAYMLRREKSPTLTLTRWGRLEGVVLQRGKPVEDALVQLQGYLSAGGPTDSETPQLMLWTQTSADGKFEFPNMPTGDFVVLAGPAPGARTRATVDAGKTERITINIAE